MVATLLVSTVALVGGASAAAVAVPVVTLGDAQLGGQAGQGPPAGGVTVGDRLNYILTVTNSGSGTIPAGAVQLRALVNQTPGGSPVVDVASLAGAAFGIGGPTCSTGARTELRCTVSTALNPGQNVQLNVTYSHVNEEAGRLSFGASVLVLSEQLVDINPGNNAFSGAQYGFATTTTTTVPDTTTTVPEVTTTTEAETTTTVEEVTPPTEVEETTTTEAETTTTVEETTTTEAEAPTTTVAPATTLPPTTPPPTTLAPAAEENATTTIELVPSVEDGVDAVSDSGVLGATGEAADGSVSPEAVAAPVVADDGGSRTGLVILIGLGTLVVGALVGGLIYFLYYREDEEPLVDIRQYR